jgi:hypothetical protein
VAKQRRGPKHKTKLDREHTLQEVARLERSGFNQYEIAARLGFSQAQVSIYQKQLRERYAASQLNDTAELVAEKWAQYDDVVREAKLAWDRSQDSNDPGVRKAGDAAFLRVQMEAWDAQRKLLGLDAPTKSDVRAAVASVSVGAAVASVSVGGVTGADGLPRTPDGRADWAALSGRPPVQDPTDAADVPALPEHKNRT